MRPADTHRFAANRADARRVGAPGRKPSAARLRPRHRRDLPLRTLPGTTRPGLARQPRRARCRVRARARGRQPGIVGVVTAYHGVNKRQPPKPDRLPRHREITERSRIFNPGAIDAVNGTELIHIWLEHLLVLSMLQHPSPTWRWGRLVVVHPACNTDFAEACDRYPGATRRPVDVLVHDPRRASGRQCPRDTHCGGPARAVHPSLISPMGRTHRRIVR